MARTAHSRFTNIPLNWCGYPPDSSAAFLEDHIRQDMTDIKDISEKELTKLYAEYQAELGRPVPVHRQGRNIPGCVSTEASAAWTLK
jgi:hypothetical protein